MKRCLVCGVIILVVLGTAGCSGLQARGPMSQTIDANALAAQTQIASIEAGTFQEADARAALENNAAIFGAYYDACTTNWFVYTFGDKTLFVNATYYQLLMKAAVLSKATALSAPLQDASWAKDIALQEAYVIIHISAAKAGKESL